MSQTDEFAASSLIVRQAARVVYSKISTQLQSIIVTQPLKKQETIVSAGKGVAKAVKLNYYTQVSRARKDKTPTNKFYISSDERIGQHG